MQIGNLQSAMEIQFPLCRGAAVKMTTAVRLFQVRAKQLTLIWTLFFARVCKPRY